MRVLDPSWWTTKKISILITLVIVAAIAYYAGEGMTGRNTIQTYQVWQGAVSGKDIIDSPGYYNKAFGMAWSYPKSIQAYWSASSKEGVVDDESILVHFNDAGKANISTFAQIDLPIDKESRLKLHEKSGGNIDYIKNMVHAHLINCIQVSGPLMSASENQASRKAEFNQVVEDQLRHGLFETKRVRVKLPDRVDDKGQPVYVDATEIVLDEKGVPVRAEKSPLETYGLQIVQFSITGILYDDLTNKQFAAKQTSYLAAEQSKAQREQEIQQKLMVVAQGERQAAEIEAEANKVKKKATVEAQQKVEVATLDKEAAETAANQTLSVSKIEKERAETLAAQEAAVAKIDADRDASVRTIAAAAVLSASTSLAQAKEKEADGIIAIAQARQKELQLGGAVPERDKVLAQIAADRDVQVAVALSKIAVPQNIIIGGGSGDGKNGGEDFTKFMFNMTLLKNLGILDNRPLVGTTK